MHGLGELTAALRSRDDCYAEVEEAEQLREKPLGFCCNCACRFKEVHCTTRFVTWISGIIFYAAGMFEGATFRRWVYKYGTAANMDMRTHTTYKVQGVTVRSRSMRVSQTCKAIVYERELGRIDHNLPVMVYTHGGGFCIGDPREKVFSRLCKYFASKGFLVVAPVYRLAPENPFPAAVEDCFDTIKFIAYDETELPNADKENIVLLGDSAGGNLSLIMSTLLRDGLDAQLQPCPLNHMLNIRHITLLYPSMLLPFTTRSTVDLSDAILLPYWLSRWFLLSYLPNDSERQQLLETDRRLCPLTAGLHGLGSVSLFYGDLDPFYDECKLLGEALAEEGCSLKVHFTKNAPHGFAALFDQTARDCPDKMLEDITQALSLYEVATPSL